MMDARIASGDALTPKEDGMFHCTVCRRKFKRRFHIKRHIGPCTEKNRIEKKTFSCALCSAVFERKSRLTRHLKRHIPKVPNECGRCGKKYVRSDKYELHVRSCVHENSVGCEEAPKSAEITFSDYETDDE